MKSIQSIYLSIYPSIHPSIHLSVYLIRLSATQKDIWTTRSGRTCCFLNILVRHVLAAAASRTFRMSISICHLGFPKWSANVVMFWTFWLGHVLRATRTCTFSTSQLAKVVLPGCVFSILTWTSASHHHGVHFSDVATSNGGPTLMCFAHSDLEMRFVPHTLAMFGHLNLQR